MNLPSKAELTAEQAIAMLDLLQGFTVLGEWQELPGGLIWMRPCKLVSIVPNSYAIAMRAGNGWMWHLCVKGNQQSSGCDEEDDGPFATPELAMAAVDAHLATLPNVLVAHAPIGEKL